MRLSLNPSVRAAIVKTSFFLPVEQRRAFERRLRGWEELRKLQQADAVIVSFGKSGRTWLRVLLSRFYQLHFGLPKWHLIGFDNLHRYNPAIPKLFFTHDNYLRDYTGHDDSKMDYYDHRVLLLVRHPADTAVSQYFQWKFRMRANKKLLNGYPPQGAEIPIFDFVMKEPTGLQRITEFLNGWAQERHRIKDLLVVRYEDLRQDTVGVLGRILAFLGVSGSLAELQDAADFGSIENMRKIEAGKSTSWNSKDRLIARDRDNPDSYKVRRAKVGGYRDYFDDGQVAAIENYIASHLKPGFGYGRDEGYGA